jgi:hypothetical protein
MIASATSLALEGIFPPVDCDVEDLRMAWRDACADLRLAYHDWREVAVDARADAFVVYVAAADREAAAADAFAQARASTGGVP